MFVHNYNIFSRRCRRAQSFAVSENIKWDIDQNRRRRSRSRSLLNRGIIQSEDDGDDDDDDDNNDFKENCIRYFLHVAFVISQVYYFIP